MINILSERYKIIYFSDRQLPKLKQSLKFIDENHVFCDGIADFLTDNTDFIVIGVCGLQNSGKSTILNNLAKLSKHDEDIFRVQNYEHQMLGDIKYFIIFAKKNFKKTR